MNQERIKLLEDLREAATQLVSYTSYAEIIGAIHHNTNHIRQGCDKVQEINAKIRHMDENKRFKVKARSELTHAKQLEGNVYQFTFGWLEEEEGMYKGEAIWLPNDDTYPQDAPTSIASGDLEAVDD